MHTSKNNGLAELLARFNLDDFDDVSRPFFKQAISDTSLAICITDPHQADTPIVFANIGFCELTGYTPVEILGKNCRFLQGKGTTSESLKSLREAIDNKYLSVTEIVNYRKDGTAFLNVLHMAPLFGKDGELLLYYGSQMDTTEAVTVNLARRKRALQLSNISVWEFNPKTEEDFVDEAMVDLFEIDADPSDVTFEDLFRKVHPDDSQQVREATRACFEDPAVTYKEDFRIVLANNKTRWIRSIGGMTRASDGTGDLSFIGVSSDVTREKEYELALSQAHDTIQTIADELDHRINNMFATTAALVTAGARGGGDAKTVAAKTRERIMAMATANRLTIGKGVYGEASLKSLIEGALSPYAGTSTITIEGDAIALDRQTLNTLGLVFHELSTNSLKYGALNSAKGCLSVTWRVDDGQCLIHWKEKDGEKIDVPLESTGFGARLIDLSISQLDGTLTRDFNDKGLIVDIVLPLTKKQ